MVYFLNYVSSTTSSQVPAAPLPSQIIEPFAPSPIRSNYHESIPIISAVVTKDIPQVDEAENGKQALDTFSAAPIGHYDLILMDVQMPVMDGYAATEAIRALPRPDAAKLPIVALTANSFKEDVQKAQAHGMDAHLAKPLEYDKLIDTLFWAHSTLAARSKGNTPKG